MSRGQNERDLIRRTRDGCPRRCLLPLLPKVPHTQLSFLKARIVARRCLPLAGWSFRWPDCKLYLYFFYLINLHSGWADSGAAFSASLPFFSSRSCQLQTRQTNRKKLQETVRKLTPECTVPTICVIFSFIYWLSILATAPTPKKVANLATKAGSMTVNCITSLNEQQRKCLRTWSISNSWESRHDQLGWNHFLSYFRSSVLTLMQ